MILSFTQTIGGLPNYFIEKIWRSFPFKTQADYYFKFNLSHHDRFNIEFDRPWQDISDGGTLHNYPVAVHGKCHTIRADRHNKWGADRDIHFVINNRKKTRFQFAPVVKCTGVQKILISYWSGKPEVTVDNNLIYYWDSEIENGHMEMLKLAQNDGFGSVWDFFNYFDKDFAGKIIHWTNKRY